MLLGAGDRDDSELKMAKRSRDEFEVSEVSCTSPSAKIHAVVESCLPVSARLPCIHRFFLNLSDSFSYVVLSSDCVPTVQLRLQLQLLQKCNQL